MEENLQEQTQSQEESQVSKESISTINQLDKKTIIIVSVCSLICFLLGLLLGMFIGSNGSSSPKQPLYQRPPLNASSEFNPQNRFADGSQQSQRRRPQLQGEQQQTRETPSFQRQRQQRQRPSAPERRHRPRQRSNQEQSQNVDF